VERRYEFTTYCPSLVAKERVTRKRIGGETQFEFVPEMFKLKLVENGSHSSERSMSLNMSSEIVGEEV
jgi:hypothetical protein